MALAQLTALCEEFRTYDTGMKSDLLIEYAERFEEVPALVASRPYPEQARVPACESEAFLFLEPHGSGVKPWFAVENPQGIAAKALAVILQETLSGCPLDELTQLDESIVYDFFGRSLSMGKGQGLMGMVQMIRGEANKRQAAQ